MARDEERRRQGRDSTTAHFEFSQCKLSTRNHRTETAEGHGPRTILTVNAAPGFSQHHTGLALDIGSPTHPNLMKDFENTAAFHWLAPNAANFGFVMPYTQDNPHGFIYEPWHWVLGENSQ